MITSEVYRLFCSFLCQRTAISERFEFSICVDLRLLNAHFSWLEESSSNRRTSLKKCCWTFQQSLNQWLNWSLVKFSLEELVLIENCRSNRRWWKTYIDKLKPWVSEASLTVTVVSGYSIDLNVISRGAYQLINRVQLIRFR